MDAGAAGDDQSFTSFVVKPTNDALLAPGQDLASDETRDLLARWGRLHGIRTMLGLAATLIYLLHLGAG